MTRNSGPNHLEKRQRQIEVGTADVGMAVLSGDAFYANAQPFINYAATNFAEAGMRAASEFGGLIVSATSLALAIEIYLKALLLHHGFAAPQTHQLPDLFSKLPISVQRQVEIAYETLRAGEGEGTAELAVHVAAQGATSPPEGNWGNRHKSLVLREILRRNANAFVIWRYLFAHSKTTNTDPLVFEFLRLGFAARAIRQQWGDVAIYKNV